MITISQAVEKIVHSKPFLIESLSEGIINTSSLARKIQPEIERLTFKKVQQGAVVMALNRYKDEIQQSQFSKSLKMSDVLGDIIVRSNLIDYTFANSEFMAQCYAELLKKMVNKNEQFYTLVRGVFETNLIVNSSFEKLVEECFQNERLLTKIGGLSAITLKLNESNTSMPGIYYAILKPMAWENINIKEVVSTTNEFTILVSDEVIDRVFSIVKQLKTQ